ncbi:hypothetical protein C5748_16025 [Phyllobacterium phragmitis]|uniref:Uncharacterized protein n=1 Tax=Phyllobacterium phragmitis TaxID=2670329 RepID=A0A2S9IQ04_9HYPH|nr:hypothetical protein [Phyllobacterium phragmitis]PRD42595.1 hypothetical protein C5748_16025 [Phyllobacterium phragmitis]
MKKTFRKTFSTTVSDNPIIDVSGSGPVEIQPRDSTNSAVSGGGRTFAVELRDGTAVAIAESLLRYVHDFGQGRGVSRAQDQRLWLDLEFQEDVEMLRSQFANLLAEAEAVDGCVL